MFDPHNAYLRLQGILGFFSGLSRDHAEEIERLAEDVTFTEEEEKAVRLKIDFRILPIIVFSYICTSLRPSFICLRRAQFHVRQRTSSVSGLHCLTVNPSLRRTILIFLDRTNMCVPAEFR